MRDLNKLIQGKQLSKIEETVLTYMVEHIDEVLEMGVRGVAKANYTSTSTIMRLAKKMGYAGFIDMHYRLLPMVENAEAIQDTDMKFVEGAVVSALFRYNPYEEVRGFAKLLYQMQAKYIFIYATGFSAIAAEYMYKKFLVLGKKCILSTGTDSIGIFENNLEDMEIFIGISKSGETKSVINKMTTAKEMMVKTVAVTGDGQNNLGKLADIHFQIQDNNKLDDRNITANNFFPNVLLLIEVLVYEHHKILLSESPEKSE